MPQLGARPIDHFTKGQQLLRVEESWFLIREHTAALLGGAAQPLYSTNLPTHSANPKTWHHLQLTTTMVAKKP